VNKQRCFRLIENAINSFELDLSGFNVLTEAATGHYSLTPLIASLAGADSVLALTRNSRFGSEDQVHQILSELSTDYGAKRIEIGVDRKHPEIGKADIVTNLGFVRPLDFSLLSQLRQHASVSLMWEPWEFRESDVDLSACQSLGIPILGTNEDDERLQTGRYVGHLAVKLLFEMNVEILKSRVLVCGSGKFGRHTVQTLKALGAEIYYVNSESGMTMAAPEAKSFLASTDAIVFCEHVRRDCLMGPSGDICPTDLYEINGSIILIHICGCVDVTSIRDSGLTVNPSTPAEFGFMTVATDYLGPRPLIDLHVAGLLVGQNLASARRTGKTAREAEDFVSANLSVAAEFPQHIREGA
jgi:hypothetical protein